MNEDKTNEEMNEPKKTPGFYKARIRAMRREIRKTEQMIQLRNKMRAVEERLDDLRKQL